MRDTAAHMARAFDLEIEHAREEVARLAKFLKSVIWYNFEVVCRNWRDPWHESMLQSRIYLISTRVELLRSRGRVRTVRICTIMAH